MTKVVYASASTTVDEFLYTRRGEYFPADDPAVLRHPEAFQEDPPEDCIRRTTPPRDFGDVLPPVEQATAAPGEVRKTRRND
jgi:hypothetical protein